MSVSFYMMWMPPHMRVQGLTGVSLKGGNRTTLTPCNHMAFANHVHDYSRFILC
ncbi:unnamed protein product, partial [marine sediment metagenome]